MATRVSLNPGSFTKSSLSRDISRDTVTSSTTSTGGVFHGTDSCVGKDRYQLPLLDKNNVEDLFQSLMQANKGGKLQNMTLKLGDWASSRVRGYHPYSDVWMMDRKLKIFCSTSSNLDVMKLCHVEDSVGYWPPGSNCWGSEDYLWSDF